ncbi:hypothetical protein CGLO_17256 [Colletotrichum gloeosporioides Cg-14]|uniref:Alpha-mannosyltransferase alg11p n=1 Tax=Colletotrichum gloeosporioides (strain Cg-14) TaxID=1237896 RepID=T0JLI4_COLGC|nr:hypothetical protein CGLO_17256 [Colletotrichum gloeosporioides Cg-14]
MAVSNARPWAIFTGYMILAAALTTNSIAIIRSQRKSSLARSAQDDPGRSARRRAVPVFGILAVVSLATTWYHMFRFFEWSYQQWAISHVFAGVGVTGGEQGLRLGEWLRDTSLFKQAWASTLETGPRAWWSLQIFGFCANWSVLLAVQAQKRKIPQAWIFILLGQVVAISFAANLSFLAILCSNAPSRPSSKDGKGSDATRKAVSSSSSMSWYTVILTINLLWATSIPSATGSPGFLALLLGPHLLAFAPLVLKGILPAHMLGDPTWFFKLASMAWVLAVAFRGIVGIDKGMTIVIKTLYEHPAVSSVGWDVICCWVSFGAWYFIGVE